MIATASWEWCEPALSNIMKIIRELRAELLVGYAGFSLEKLPPVTAARYRV